MIDKALMIIIFMYAVGFFFFFFQYTFADTFVITMTDLAGTPIKSASHEFI